jgi:hypothetical protein
MLNSYQVEAQPTMKLPLVTTKDKEVFAKFILLEDFLEST